MTPKQEHFARLYVETGNASEAYRQAYNAENMKPETVTNEAYKLLQDPDISAMVDDLKAEARQRHRVTVDDLLHELEQARAAALAAPTPQSSAAVSATMGKAKMLGLLVDRAEVKAEAEIYRTCGNITASCYAEQQGYMIQNSGISDRNGAAYAII